MTVTVVKAAVSAVLRPPLAALIVGQWTANKQRVKVHPFCIHVDLHRANHLHVGI